MTSFRLRATFASPTVTDMKISLLSFFFLVLFSTFGSCQENVDVELTSGFIQHPTYGVIPVSWFYVDGLVVYDGDVIFGTIAEFNKVLINVTYTSTGGLVPPSSAI